MKILPKRELAKKIFKRPCIVRPGDSITLECIKGQEIQEVLTVDIDRVMKLTGGMLIEAVVDDIAAIGGFFLIGEENGKNG